MFHAELKGFDKLKRRVEGLQRQARFATAQTLNDVAFEVREDLRRTMTGVFDRPTPYITSSVWVDKATRESLVARIYPRSRGASDIDPKKVLRSEVKGGARRWKRSEVLLNKAGLLPEGWYAVPGKAAHMDAYGNMQRGQILHLLSYFKAYPATTRSGKSMRSNMGDASRGRLKAGTRSRFGTEYFVIQPADRVGLRPGIWMRQTRGTKQRRIHGPGAPVRLVLAFVNGAKYSRRFDMAGVARQTVRREFAPRFRAAFARAPASAR